MLDTGLSVERRLLLVALAWLLIAQPSFGLETIRIQNASDEYDFDLEVDVCGGGSRGNDADDCGGKARISIFRKGLKSPIQVLSLPNSDFSKSHIAYNPKINRELRVLYGAEYGLVFDDFNFDGYQDLAISNGKNGGYGAHSYNVYLFDNKSNRFIENRRLTRLTEAPNLGLFFVDKEKKQLAVESKSGCCFHETKSYKMVNNKPMLVERLIDDATGDIRVVTTARLVNGRWVKSVKKEALNEKEQGN